MVNGLTYGNGAEHGVAGQHPTGHDVQTRLAFITLVVTLVILLCAVTVAVGAVVWVASALGNGGCGLGDPVDTWVCTVTGQKTLPWIVPLAAWPG